MQDPSVARLKRSKSIGKQNSHVLPLILHTKSTKSCQRFLMQWPQGNISDLQAKLHRWENFLFELPSKIESIKEVPKKLIEKRNEIIAKQRIAKNKMESGDYNSKAPFQPKTLVVALLPFLPVLLYLVYVF